jgi:pimeloyl-ACP methyl ester carboxylesterase
VIRTKLVLLPGLDGTAIFFRPLLDALPSWIDPLVVTYPATGPNAYADLIPVVIRAVNALEHFAVLGWSFGGPLALMLAAQRPSRVSEVILCSSFVTPPNPRLVRYRALFTTPVIAAIRAIRRTRYVIPGFSPPALRRAKIMTWRQVNARTLGIRARAVLDLDARELLAGCSAPILYMSSTRDEVIPRASMDQILAIAPGTKIAEIMGAHLAMFTNPDVSAARIAEFPAANATRVRRAGKLRQPGQLCDGRDLRSADRTKTGPGRRCSRAQ